MPRDRVMIQVAAELLITPILEHLVTVWVCGSNTGTKPATYTRRPLLSMGETAPDLSHPMHH